MQLNKKYTYKEYLTWLDNERWELIDGVPYNMTPAPSTRHQNIVGSFSRIIRNNLIGKSCIPFVAPTDVILSELDVVQPDVFVVCDKRKITEANIQGAPDLIIEVMSPVTGLKDRREKKALYEKYRVKEYIIIDPINNYGEQYVLKDNGYEVSEVFGPEDVLTLHSLESIEIPFNELLEEK